MLDVESTELSRPGTAMPGLTGYVVSLSLLIPAFLTLAAVTGGLLHPAWLVLAMAFVVAAGTGLILVRLAQCENTADEAEPIDHAQLPY